MGNLVKELQAQVAGALLECGAVIFTPDEPITFKSGIKAPVYIDNRRLPFFPFQWQIVIEGFKQLIALDGCAFNVIAGIEAAGIPHSSALAYVLKVPSVFVRKQAKEHGTRSRIEGGDVDGKRVLLVEDMITTGGSSLAGVEALREVGATVEDCICVASYGFEEAARAFEAAHVRLHVLAPFAAIVLEASRLGRCGEYELEALEAWSRDPHNWDQARPTPGQEDTQ
ncbi:MAG: orotate phosphoribosyltransferase [Anaerolineae bacterium]|nr:orotate phosphoribosyltransferase [Anaerolineae bacterium]